MSKKIHIYGIRDLGSEYYSYIGRTTDTPEKRVIRHLHDALSGKHRNRNLAEFIISNKFQVDLLCITYDPDVEYFYIRKYKKLGHPLLNQVYKTKKKRKKRDVLTSGKSYNYT